jgi:hypothetical protein
LTDEPPREEVWAMIHRQSRDGRHRNMLQRIEQTADALNPFLLVIVIGLAILDVSVFAALELHRLSVR